MRLKAVPLVLSVLVGASFAVRAAGPAGAPQAKPSANPVMVLDTAKGVIEITFFQAEAPKSVEHIVALVRRSFYRGQRFHRVDASLAQFGDRYSRDMTLRDRWGGGGSGSPINVFELSKTRKHARGTVALAHAGNPMTADSQLYIMKRASPSLDGKHAIIGQVTAGMAVVDRIEVEDLIKNATIKGEGPK
jgi:cyclophilin family peptidyl-prolyl cis-trans isomerase